MPHESAKGWERLGTEPGPDLILFRARFDRVRHPRTGRELKAVVLEAPDWVNVLAITAAGKIVAVRQHRFGTGKTTTELPAGIVEAGESHRAAGERELLEETGYAGGDWTYLGAVEPNPAFLPNLCHHWLARGAERVSEPAPDETEEIETVEMGIDEVRREIAEGRMRHSLAITALSAVFDLRSAPLSVVEGPKAEP
ncbi:MAG: NUDIX hydrolase [Planctomycetes bacterium]|jgi:8-oxo-dGTP pyrophosphatase MutT (NUDIX family)|nr:NUDIX hydrolase [Planctomycetota bacterium]